MHMLIAPFVVGGLVLKIYNHSKSNLINKNKVTINQHSNTSCKNTRDLGININEQQRQKETVSV